MIDLTPLECRVLGVLVEKAFTVPASYPLTLNAIVVGSNQKNNRDPLTNIDEEAALDALDGLRRKGLAVEVFLSGSRVAKYKHNARDGLRVSTEQLVVLTELLLRGPQTLGSLRANASRMQPLDSLEKVTEIVESLIHREGGLSALVEELPPEGRARRFAQVLCPTLHASPRAAAPRTTEPPPAPAQPHAAAPAEAPRRDAEARLAELERKLSELSVRVESIARELGIRS